MLGRCRPVDSTARYRRPTVSILSVAFVWCGCCHCVYPAAWWTDNGEECPSVTCDGTLADAWAWGEALLREHPD